MSYLVRQSDVSPYSPANHSGTKNFRLIGPDTVGSRNLEVIVGEIESARSTVVRLVERRHGLQIAELVQQIVATTLTAAQARALGARAGKPALHVTRQYFDAQGRLLMATVGVYPSDRFSHNTRFRIQAEH